MPLFGNKFSPKKTPIRKSHANLNSDKLPDDLVGEQRSITLHLGDQNLLFDNGEWMPASDKSNSIYKLNHKLKKKNQDLQEENNLLRIKYELIVNMLTQLTADSQIQEKELEKLKKSVKRSPF